MTAAKREGEALLEKLSDECTLEDIQYHLYVIEKIQNGIKIAEKHGTVSQEDAEPVLAKGLQSKLVTSSVRPENRLDEDPPE